MKDFQLKIGGRSINLHKSDEYIGIRPAQGKAASMEMETLATARGPAAEKALGGFRLVRVDAAPQPMEETLDTLRASPSVKAGTHVYHTSEDKVPFVPTGQLYIECDPNAGAEQCRKLLEEHSLQILEARGRNALVVQVTPKSSNPIKVAQALQASPLVVVAEPELATPGKIQKLPVDARIGDQWHLRNVGIHHGTAIGFKAGADARVIAAWQAAKTLGASKVVVAVIDDGFDLGHPDLGGAKKIVAPRDFQRDNDAPLPDPHAGDWHGTACAGVAIGNANGTGIVGAAPACRLMPVRWGEDLSDRELEAWFGHVTAGGADVVSCSWSAAAAIFPLSTRAHRAIERCARDGRGGRGCVVCFAAGNEDRDINNPPKSLNGFAIHPDVIAVAASNSVDEKSDYSNFGAEIWLCAPSSDGGGWGITTADVMGQYTKGGVTREAGYATGAYTDDFGGTSSATPLVAGIAALILSIAPNLRASEVKKLLRDTARKIGPAAAYTNGRSREYGYGCVDAAAAVKRLAAPGAAKPQAKARARAA